MFTIRCEITWVFPEPAQAINWQVAESQVNRLPFSVGLYSSKLYLLPKILHGSGLFNLTAPR